MEAGNHKNNTSSQRQPCSAAVNIATTKSPTKGTKRNRNHDKQNGDKHAKANKGAKASTIDDAKVLQRMMDDGETRSTAVNIATTKIPKKGEKKTETMINQNDDKHNIADKGNEASTVDDDDGTLKGDGVKDMDINELCKGGKAVVGNETIADDKDNDKHAGANKGNEASTVDDAEGTPKDDGVKDMDINELCKGGKAIVGNKTIADDKDNDKHTKADKGNEASMVDDAVATPKDDGVNGTDINELCKGGKAIVGNKTIADDEEIGINDQKQKSADNDDTKVTPPRLTRRHANKLPTMQMTNNRSQPPMTIL
jgi:hypothetical protein